jgi:hypothetical protein
MQLRKFRTLSAVCSIALVACGKGPKVDICISDPPRNGAQCVDKKQQPYFRAYEETENYVMLSPADAEALLN